MNKRFKQWINSALDFVFPQHLKCHSCSKEAAVNEYGICSECEAGLAVNPLAEQIEFVDEYAAGLFYNDVSKRAVYALKYNGAVYVREFLTHFMCIPADWPIDCIVPGSAASATRKGTRLQSKFHPCKIRGGKV